MPWVSSVNIREEFVEASEFENSGQRVVVGQRLMQAVSDYLRQLGTRRQAMLEAVKWSSTATPPTARS
jgi:hypothetical protein